MTVIMQRRVSLATWTLLAAVVSRLSLAAGQSNSSCGIDATPGIRFTGQVWPDWTASKGASADAWSMAGIPAESQAWQADSAQECNCLCTRVTNCVGYTWLGGDVKRCWLMSFVLWWVNPSPEFVDPSLPFSENVETVPMDTVVGRVVNGSWPVCSDGVYALQDQQLTSMTWHSINRTVVGPFYENVATQCNAACGQASGCVAFTWQQNLTDVAVSAASVISAQAAAAGSILVAGDGTDLGSQPAMCVLYSVVQGPLFPYQPNNNATIYLAPFQACDMGPNVPASPPPSPQPSPPVPSPSVPASPAPVAQPSPAPPSPAPSPPLGAPQVLPGLLTLAAAALAAVLLLQSM